jgi:hypothetical protein
MLQATAVHDHPVPQAQRPVPSRSLARWLVAAGAVGLVGVTIDLVQGPPASALSAHKAHGAAPIVLAIDHSVVKGLADSAAIEPGASVAAYESSADSSQMKVLAAAPKDPVDATAATNPVDSLGARDASIHHASTVHAATPVATNRGDDGPLEPGASIAAYGS